MDGCLRLIGIIQKGLLGFGLVVRAVDRSLLWEVETGHGCP